MIVGTAGHIDHGKTTLVRALTGTDTDRLPEEKARGISIELGHAFLDASDAAGRAHRIGFIDVPGHERLVHTMLAGATGIDCALLLVAADDGPMPQTREHLAVLSLLGVPAGAVVVTKIDRAEPDQRQATRAALPALVRGSALEAAPVFEVSAATGEGLPALRQWLGERAAATPPRAAAGRRFRLAVDRCFSAEGVGTVVAGTVHAGEVAIGDELALLTPGRGTGGGAAWPVRVRALQSHGQALDQAGAGRRVAVALVGIARDAVRRGDWLVSPELASARQRLDLRVRVWPGEGQALRSGTPVHVHLGAAQAMGSLVVLQGPDPSRPESLAPGQQGLAQLVLHHPLGAWWGDRIVLRDASAQRCIAGGQVLDPSAPSRHRRTPQRLTELHALDHPEPAARIPAWLAACPLGGDLQAQARAQGLDLQTVEQALEQAVSGDTLVGQGTLEDTHWRLHADHLAPLQTALLQALDAFHRSHPDEIGPDAARLRRLAAPRLALPLWRALLAEGRKAGRIAVRGAFVHRPDHLAQLSAIDQRIAQKIAPMLAAAGIEGAWARDLARDAGEGEPLMRTTLARLAQRGEVHMVVRDLYLAPSVHASLAATARRLAEAHGGEVTAAGFRDATGLGRKRAIQVLEHFDRIGLTRRVGDLHRLRVDSPLGTEPPASRA